MKKFLLFIMCALLFTACSNNDYTNVIPVNSKAVMYIDFKTIAAKAGLGNVKEQNKLQEVLLKGLQGDDREEGLKYVAEPMETGIDFGSRVYGFFTANDYFCMTAKVNDDDDLEDFIAFLKKQGLASNISDRNGVNYAEIYGSVQVAYNSSTCMFAMGTGNAVKNTLAQLLSQDKERSFVTSPKFEKLNTSDSDIALLTSLDIVPKEYVDYFRTGLPESVDNEKVGFLSELSFNDGELLLKGKAFSDVPSVQKLLDKKSGAFGKIKGTYFDKIPVGVIYEGHCMAWGAFNANGAKMLDFCRKIPAIRTMLIGANMGVDADLMIKALNGDVQFTYSMPDTYYVHAQVANNNFADGKTSFTADFDEKKVFFDAKDVHNLKVSNNQLMLPSKSYGDIGRSYDKATQSVEGVKLTDKTFFVTFFVDAFMQQPDVKSGLGQVCKVVPTIGKFIGNFDIATLSSTGNNDFEFRIVMRNKDNNALYSLW